MSRPAGDDPIITNPDGYQSIPDSPVVLLEGINKSGKDFICDSLKEEFAGQVFVQKFPHNPQIIKQIKTIYAVLYKISKQEKNDDGLILGSAQREALLTTIHDLFHVDFGLFDYRKLGLMAGKLIIFNRWMPSNIVYGRLHGVYQRHWYQNYGDLIPDYCYYLRVNREDFEKYVNIFPMGINTFSTEEQILSPAVLFDQGQQHYIDMLPEMVMGKKMWGVETVRALHDNTYTHIRDDLLKKGWLK